MDTQNNIGNQQNRELTITRVFHAPRELVFQAWTDPELLSQWWGPRGVTTPICEIDAHAGGHLHIEMLAGDELGELKGQRWPMEGTIEEILKPERIVYTSTAIYDEDGTPNLESRVTITFEEQGSETKMVLHVVITRATAKAQGPLQGMEMGWTQSIDKLQELLAQQSKTA